MYLIDRLKEPSTWRGITALLTAFGIITSEEQAGAIIATGLSLIGLIGVFFPDKMIK